MERTGASMQRLWGLGIQRLLALLLLAGMSACIPNLDRSVLGVDCVTNEDCDGDQVCVSKTCIAPSSVPPETELCGNGQVDEGETCDPTASAGCPVICDDANACTEGTLSVEGLAKLNASIPRSRSVGLSPMAVVQVAVPQIWIQTVSQSVEMG